jgi:hypothetical protein
MSFGLASGSVVYVGILCSIEAIGKGQMKGITTFIARNVGIGKR